MILKKLLWGLLLVGLTTACGSKKGGKGSSDSSGGGAEGTFTDVFLNFTQKSSLALLAPTVDSYTGEISGCVSGYSKALTEANASVKVQNGDVGCKFKINTISIGGESYTFAGTEDWSVGSSIIITGGAGTETSFKVVSQISSPISGPQSVLIVYGAAEEGSSSTTGADIDAGISISGSESINLDVVSHTLTVDGVSGAGIFGFKLGCSSAVVGSGASATCGSEVIESLNIGLAVDSFGAGDLSMSECRTVAGNTLHGTAVAAGDAELANGGLDTGSITGPARLYDAANAALVMAISSASADGGCKYFRIAITPP